MDWLQQTAMGKQNNLRLNSSGDKGGRTPDAGMGESRERSGGEVDAAAGEAGEEGLDGFNDDDTPLTWAEVRSIAVDPFSGRGISIEVEKWVSSHDRRCRGKFLFRANLKENTQIGQIRSDQIRSPTVVSLYT